MKYWDKWLDTIIGLGHIVSISREGNEFIICEECDGYYDKTFSKEEAIEVLEEALAWIKEQPDGL